MNNSTIINFKTDPVLKKQAMKLSKDLGFSLSSIINAYLKHFVRTKAVSFSLYNESHPTRHALRQLKKSQKDIKEGRVSPAFSNLKDAVKWLESEDKS